ncbi:MAG: hypothetical protein JWM57_6 [Phycisphaerales bacterium]|nr:hypothetical protein [Phycisphaerales bacterium]
MTIASTIEGARVAAAIEHRPHVLCVNNVTTASAERLQVFLEKFNGEKLLSC